MKKSILLLSNSYVYGSDYLVHYTEPLSTFLRGIPSIVFVPFAADERDWNTYTEVARDFFNTLGIAVVGIHQIPNDRIFKDFKAIFVGGGSTLRLLNELLSRNLFSVIRSRVLLGEIKYVGVSAGSNLAGRKICLNKDITVDGRHTNIEGLNLLPFQINPHEGDYLSSEVRDTPLIGLRARMYISVYQNSNQDDVLLFGGSNGKLVFNDNEYIEIPHSTKFVLTSDGRLEEAN